MSKFSNSPKKSYREKFRSKSQKKDLLFSDKFIAFVDKYKLIESFKIVADLSLTLATKTLELLDDSLEKKKQESSKSKK